tara:strand:+ start:684 stop:905 length:222 start_codon:yes stop_codon:yes gene_type:complete
MKTIENISTGDVFEALEIEYFIDEDTQIGEVYIDGDLIFQSLDVLNDDQLEHAFRQEFKLLEEVSDIFLDFNG